MQFEDYFKKRLNEDVGDTPSDFSNSDSKDNQSSPEPPLFTSSSMPVSKPKWKASKNQIMSYWKTLRGDQPIPMRPIGYNHKGSTYGEDGIRITGTPNFIQAVLGKLRELLRYEGPSTKLAVVYRQTVSQKRLAMGLPPTSFVFYIQAKERGKKRKKT